MTCAVGTLAVNASVQRVITAIVNSTVAPGTSLENSAVVTSTTGDSNPLNNSATADTSILGYADLTISKSQLTPDPITAGSLVTYTIRITNTGPGLARNVDVKDQLPAGMNLVSANASDGGVCGGAVCQFGTLRSGRHAHDHRGGARRTAAAATPSLTNTAAVYSPTKASRPTTRPRGPQPSPPAPRSMSAKST